MIESKFENGTEYLQRDIAQYNLSEEYVDGAKTVN